jgi:hypothetical protein
MQALINNFIRKNLQISDERVQLPVECGGLGFFNIKDFLQAQMSTWIFRAKKLPIDNWHYDLCSLSPGNNPLLIRTSDVNKNSSPILYGLVLAYECFYNSFAATGNNYLFSYIFDNDVFRDTVSGNKIKKGFFGENFYNNNSFAIRSLKFNDCFYAGNFKNIELFRQSGLNLTLAVWLRLRSAILQAKNRMMGRDICHDKGITIHTFVDRWRRGSKKVRKFLTKKSDPTLSRHFIKFKELVARDPEGNDIILSPWFQAWNISYFNNEFREFIFKYRYNYLPLNNRLNAFMPEVDPRCTYCTMLNRFTVQRDSFRHCFLECDTVLTLLQKLLSLLRFDVALPGSDFYNLYWYGLYRIESLTRTRHFIFLLVFDAFRKKFPRMTEFFDELRFFLNCILMANKKTKILFLNTYEVANFLQARG